MILGGDFSSGFEGIQKLKIEVKHCHIDHLTVTHNVSFPPQERVYYSLD